MCEVNMAAVQHIYLLFLLLQLCHSCVQAHDSCPSLGHSLNLLMSIIFSVDQKSSFVKFMVRNKNVMCSWQNSDNILMLNWNADVRCSWQMSDNVKNNNRWNVNERSQVA